MRTLSDKTEFSLHFLIFKNRILRSDLPENLDFLCTDSSTNGPTTISFRCDDEEWFDRILVLSFKDGNVLNPIKKYTTEGFFGKTGGIELISEYLLSNFITDTDDEEYRSQTWINEDGNEIITDSSGRLIVDWVSTDYIPPFQAEEGSQFSMNGMTYKYNGHAWVDDNENYIDRDSSGKLVLNGRATDFYPHRLDNSEEEFIFNDLKYKKVYVNNLTLAPDFRNLLQQREYPNFDYDFDGPMYGNKRFQHNINQIGLKRWNEHYSIPEFIFEILTHEQKRILSERLSNLIQLSWESIFRNVFNQKFEVKDDQVDRNMSRDTWGSDMYSSLGGDGEEDVYLSEGISIRPDGSLTDD